MLSVTNEKDVLVRHSARTVHIEAELGNCKEKLARLRKLGIGTTAEAKTETGVWRDGAEGLGRVLRSYIYGHTRWEKLVSDEFAGAVDAHEHGQRSTVRLVAAAEREAAGLAGEAIEVLRATRQLLSEYGRECAATVDTIKRTVTRNADERVNAALDKLHVAEQRATLAVRASQLQIQVNICRFSRVITHTHYERLTLFLLQQGERGVFVGGGGAARARRGKKRPRVVGPSKRTNRFGARCGSHFGYHFGEKQ